MTREDHLGWCKRRALDYVENGDFIQAFSSMVSDLSKHPETENHVGIELGMMLLMTSNLDDKEKMRHFIEGFN